MLRAITASATDSLAAVTEPLSVASMLSAMSRRFTPEITSPAHNVAAALFAPSEPGEAE